MIVLRYIMLYATTAINRKDGSLDKTWSHRHNQSDLHSTWNSVSDVINFLKAPVHKNSIILWDVMLYSLVRVCECAAGISGHVALCYKLEGSGFKS